MKKSISSIFMGTAVVVLALCACTGKSFNISGTITEAKDSVLYLENMSLSGPVAVDSVKLGESGTFSFSEQAPDAPEFYRLRIAGQIINLAVDSTEQIEVKAQYPTMSAVDDVTGSEECTKIKELALLQMDLQRRIDAIVAAPDLGVSAVQDSVLRVTEAYKDQVKRQYIFAEPMKAYAYYALFQTVRLGQMESLIFNPRSSEQDVKVFAAVATSWDTYHPDAERGQNLHNIAIEGMKNVRILQSRQLSNIDPNLVNVSNVIDINLPDSKGRQRRLTELKGKVVLLDFHVFASEGSTQRIMQLREIYNTLRDWRFIRCRLTPTSISGSSRRLPCLGFACATSEARRANTSCRTTSRASPPSSLWAATATSTSATLRSRISMPRFARCCS